MKYLNALTSLLADIPRQSRKKLDRGILLLVCALCAFGTIMIWSASMYNAGQSQIGDSLYYVRKQAVFFAAGLILMLTVSVFNYRYLKVFSNLIMVISAVLLVALMLLPKSEGANGAVRWLRIAGITVQPAELAKIAVMMFMSYHLEKLSYNVSGIQVFGLVLLYCAAVCLLIYAQPALSTAIIVAVIIIGMYFIAGGNILYILSLAGLGGAAVYLFIRSNEWRMNRFFAFLDPFSDILGEGWQPAQSLMALGSGGLLGKGLGAGSAKFGFLPFSENDYIFAVIGEELGLVGCLALLFTYFLLILRIARIAISAQDAFSRLFCSGMAILFGIQVFLNVAVVTNIMPSTGIILPLVSSGGSSLLTLMIGMGIVLNISRNCNEKLQGR
ncbi:MAG: putative lipid II flippase FtsW [Eubacteriaceae bacterium]|nr:putative lipid II flippase FtsW [Eubacteriaceae bacterium]MBR5995081.1 putative lipid II flippase FtsW [Eubacteriaceae bacterium]